MEFLEGLTLDAMVRRYGPVSAGRAVYLLRQVCHSLGEAHARGMVHRDIKPANIFSSRLGPDCDFVKVLDFGLVKQTTDLNESTALTGLGVAAGTPAFMAPEVALSQADVDPRADIYAVGCVAYWLLTGEVVFKRDTSLATVLAHVRDTPEPPGCAHGASDSGGAEPAHPRVPRQGSRRPGRRRPAELASRLDAIDVDGLDGRRCPQVVGAARTAGHGQLRDRGGQNAGGGHVREEIVVRSVTFRVLVQGSEYCRAQVPRLKPQAGLR